MEDQKLENYLSADILKYKSLALLRDRFCTRLFVVYYPIPKDIDYIIVEEVNGTPDHLFAGRRMTYRLPVKRDAKKMDNFAKEFIGEVLGEKRLTKGKEPDV